MPGYYKRRSELKSLVTSYKDCPVKIKKQEYVKIVKGFMNFIMDKIHEGETVSLPAGMGQIEIVGQKKRVTVDEDGQIYGLSTDWVKTFKLWNDNPEAKIKKKRIYHFNEHSKGIRYRFAWTKNRVPMGFYSKKPYTFIPSRKNKRRLWKSIIDDHKEYRVRDFYTKTNSRTIQLINQKNQKKDEVYINGHSLQQGVERSTNNSS